MPITLDPLLEKDLAGLREPGPLLDAFNRLQAECGALLNSGLTLANAYRVELFEKELVTPDEWVALTPLNGFADIGAASNAGSLAVRKSAAGRVELREVVNRPAGPPGGTTVIANLPAGYGPQAAALRIANANGAMGVYTIDPATSALPARVRWVSGTPTSNYWLAGGSWEAADHSLPAWPIPVRLRIRDLSARTVRHVVLLARTADSATTGVAPTVHFPGPTIEKPARAGELPVLVLPRIEGLQPLTRYRVSIAALLE